MKKVFFALILPLVGLSVWGQNDSIFSNTETVIKKKKVVLEDEKEFEFEGDQIEGEAIDPGIISKVQVEDSQLDSILFVRKDFNEFVKAYQKWRPRFLKYPRKLEAGEEE